MKKRLIGVLFIICACAVVIAFTRKEKSEDIKFQIKNYQNGNSIGKTVEVSGLKDKEKEKKINGILLKDSQAVLSPYDLTDKNVTVTMNVNYAYDKEQNILTVIYNGIYNNKTAAHPTAFYAISKIDLNTGNRIDDSVGMDYKKLINAILMGDFTVIADSSELRDAQKDYLIHTDRSVFETLFKNINFKEENGKIKLPDVFLVKDRDKITVVLPTFHALGNYAIIEVLEKDMK